MLKKYLTLAVLAAVLAVGFAVPQLGRAQTTDDAYIKTLQETVRQLRLQVDYLNQQINVINTRRAYPLNQPPTVSVSGSSTVPAGESRFWLFRATDPEGLDLSYIVNWGDSTPVATGTTASGQSFSLQHTYTRLGSSTIVFSATDRGGRTASTLFTVVVFSLNKPPFFTQSFIGPTSTISGVSYTWYSTAVDPDGGGLNYRVQWGDGSADTYVKVASSGVSMSFPHVYYATTASTTIYYPLVIATDFGNPPRSVQSGPLTVRVYPNNQPPIAYVYGSSTVPVGVSNPWFFQAYDREDAYVPLIINWGDGTPPIQFVATSTLTYFPLYHTYTSVGTSVISIYVTDSGGLSAGSSIPVTIISSSTPPFTVTSVSPSSGPVGTTITVRGSGFSTVYTSSMCFPILTGGCYVAYYKTTYPTVLQFTVPSIVPVGNYNVYICSPGCLISSTWPFTVTSSSSGPLPFPADEPQSLNSIESLQAQLANIQAQLQALLLLLSQY